MNQEGFKRKLTAILSADAAGYSRLMGDDEEATVRTIKACREVITLLIQQYNGSVLDSPGDNMLAEFASVVDSVRCAVAIQKEIKEQNDQLPEHRRMLFRIGINLGDVIEEDGRIYGDGVNIAARLEGLAEPGGICVSKTVVDHIESKLPYHFEFIGDQMVKNIARPVGAYKVMGDTKISIPEGSLLKKLSAIRSTPFFWGMAVVIALAIALGFRQLYFHSKSDSASQKNMATPLSEKPSIAVLPFDNLSDDAKQEYFSDGMTEEIITKLSMNPRIAVIARNSTFYYKGKLVKIKQIGQELGARYVVEGSVRKSGNTVRITAQLIDATTEKHLWAETYDREFEDIFKLQDEIARQIVAALNIKYREAEQARALRVPTENLTAYDSLLRGQSHFFRFTEVENEKAKEMFERATELDPEYASAYVLLGYAYFMEYAFGSYSDPRILERVSELARKALSLDSSSSFAYVLLADVSRTKGLFDEAMFQAKRALTLNPNSPAAYLSLGNTLNAIGRSEDAVKAIKKAMVLDPHYGIHYEIDLARAYQYLGKYKEAIVSLKSAIARNPDWFPSYFDLAMNYCIAWRIMQDPDPTLLDRAQELTEKLISFDDGAFLSAYFGHFVRSLIHLYKKEHTEALDEAEILIALSPGSADSYALKATILNLLGRSEEAIAIIEKAKQLTPNVPSWYLSTLASAYASSGREAEAVSTHKKILEQNPSHKDAVQAHLDLTILYASLGQEVDARAEAREVQKLVPNFSVKVWGQRVPINHPAQIEQSMANLRKAGLK